MGLLGNLLGKRKKRVFVLGLDGMPFALAQQLFEQGVMPTFKKLTEERGSFRSMDSVLPPVSSVAWASFMTGKNPGNHNIFGFIDRRPATLETFIPSSVDMKSETLWEILSRHGKHVVVVNVPTSYPPRKVNGILVSGFEAPSIDKATYPAEVGQKLKQMGYRIDIDPWQARQSRAKFVEDLYLTFAKRQEAVLHFMDTEPWDFFIAHIMDTDRMHHFMWKQWDEKDPEFHPKFVEFYRRVDQMIEEVLHRLTDQDTLVILSDHGFCTLHKEVYVNHYLMEKGWFRVESGKGDNLAAMTPDSKAYSLIPGRIYLNRKGRERDGWVEAGEVDRLLDELSACLLEMKDPETGESIITRVYRKEEAFTGQCLDVSPELVLLSRDGYDLKGNIKTESLTGPSELVGMHTFDNAMVYLSNRKMRTDTACVTDVMPTILDIMGVSEPGLDGRSLLE